MRPLVAAALAAAVTLVCSLSLAPATAASSPATMNTPTARAQSGLKSTPTERSLLAVTKPRGRGDLYALNDLTHHVVRFDLRQGKWQTSLIGTGWGDPTTLAVTRKGVAWVIDSTSKTLVRVAADGSQRTVLTLNHLPYEFLVADLAGNAYLLDGTKMIKVSASGDLVQVFGFVTPTAGHPVGLGVDAAGRATAVYIGPIITLNGGLANVVFAKYGTNGGTPTLRTVAAFSEDGDCCVGAVQEASTGAVVLQEFFGLGSGYTGTFRFTAGQTTAFNLHGQAAFDSRGLLYVMDQRVSCLAPYVGDGSCVPDTTVDKAVFYPAAGGSAYGTIPITNLHEPDEIAANTRGRLFAVEGPRLKTIPPGGGPAYTILQGQFFAIQTPAGK